jgi:LuxR family maltose regulon positive regulatory protein
LIRLLARAQVNIIANPFDNVVLQGRFDSYPKRRGITRVKELLAAGVNVALGHDSIMAPWFPLGRGDMLAAAQLALLLCHIILATRADPPLPLPLLRSHKQVLEVRADQLRCTPEETKAFFDQVMGIQLPDEIIQEVTARMEGWLVGLQLLGLSLPERTNPLTLLQEASGDQHYILDFLTQEVLGQQPQEIQTFLLYTSILEQLNTSLCDAVMQQHGSQQMLHRLEQTNLFVVSLDNKRQWYRYHALFAEALRNRLEQTHPDVVLALHYRASLWYTKHDRTTQAILHAFRAQEWQWAADLIEQKSLQVSVFTWGAGEHELALLRQWIEQLPLDVMKLRPHLCITCIRLFALVAPLTVLKTWLEIVEAALTASLTKQIQEDDPMSDPKVKQKLQNQLGEVIAHRAFLLSYDEHGEAALPLCQQALSLLSTGPSYSHVTINWAQLYAYYYSTNDTEAAIQSGLQGVSLTQALGHSGVAITAMCAAARHMKEAGYLHEAQQLIQQATQLGTQLGGLLTPEAGHPTVWQAELLREWNQLDAAHSFIDEAISLCKQSKTPTALMYILFGYAVLLRVSLSSGKLKMAHTALREFEHIGKSMNQPSYLYLRSFYTTIDQIKLWLACGELDRATRWAEELDRRERRGTPFAHEREEVALARILLAKSQPELALQRLEPVLQRATIGKRWSHVIEIRLLQALAHQMLKQEGQALDALSQATLLAEPEGYIRSFVDEGAQIEALLYRMRKRDCRNGPTPYLDTLLTAFQQERKGPAQVEEESIKMQPIAEPLSGRELEVLHLLVRGASNQEIAQELVIVIDTVKRHISHIFSKLGVKNRVQAIRQAQALGILSEKL